ncbi:hypothetical protein PI124_g19745 [Phytophthora idaei]|nr:hypothetical protein PI125_g20869 [Phytophthora idaei]KAG3133313.1 hypothetical protein PI126_g19232 [Phytophthora idaei]KAG3235217.1 hypothetical protein PI124_g19745 [Phytophthora idaei]
MLDYWVLVTVDLTILNAYQWMGWVVMEYHELSFYEKSRTRKYTSLTRISPSFGTTLTLLSLLCKVESFSDFLTSHLDFLIDAWTEADTYIAVSFAVTPSLISGSSGEKLLLVFPSLLMRVT